MHIKSSKTIFDGGTRDEFSSSIYNDIKEYIYDQRRTSRDAYYTKVQNKKGNFMTVPRSPEETKSILMASAEAQERLDKHNSTF